MKIVYDWWPRLKIAIFAAVATFLLVGCASRTQIQMWDSRASGREQALAEVIGMPDASTFEAQNLQWMDTSRPDGPREVLARLYLPSTETSSNGASAGKSPIPLVIFSHGIGGSREGYSYIGKYLAAEGIAALHVQHVGSDRSIWFGNPLQMVDRLQNAAKDSEAIARTQDVRFALNQVLSSAEFKHRIDAKRIAAAGHSYGANTTLLLVGARVGRNAQGLGLADPRIRAAVVISAPPFYGLGDLKNIVSEIEVPSLHITAQDDEINLPGYYSPAKDRIEIFEAISLSCKQSATSKTLAVFRDGSHGMFTDRLFSGGRALNPKIKVATRELILAFLKKQFYSSEQPIDDWPIKHQELIARYERH